MACILITLALLVGGAVWVIVRAKLIHTQALTPEQIDEIDIDYTPVTRGRWSPWRIDAKGDRVWDPVAGFNGWVRTLEENERAWPDLYLFWQTHEDIFEHDDLGRLPYEADDFEPIRAWHSDPKHRFAVDVLCQTLARPHMGSLLSDLEEDEIAATDDPHAADLRDGGTNISMFNTRGFTLGQLQMAVKLLNNAAVVAIEQGDADRFFKLMRASQGSQQLLDDFPVAIDQLVRVAILKRGLDTIRWALEKHPDRFDDAHLAALDAIMAENAIEGYGHLGEALYLEDSIRRYATRDGAFRFGAIADAFINDKELFDVIGPPTNKPVREFDESLQQPLWLLFRGNQYGADMSRLPWDGSDIELPYATPEGMELNPVSSRFAGVFTAAYDRVVKRFLKHHQEHIGTRTAIALQRHKLRHGVFPASLSALDADLLEFEPIDLFTNEHLLTTMRDGQILVYSVGGDRTDNKGEPVWNTMLGSEIHTVEKHQHWISEQRAASIMANSPHEITGDFVLFPLPRDDPFEDD